MKTFALGLLASVVVIGCSETGTPCGAAQEITDGTVTVCVFGQELIEEGFLCPDNFDHRLDFENGAVGCSSSPELTEEIEDRFDDLGLEPVGTTNPLDPAGVFDTGPIVFTFDVQSINFSKPVAFATLMNGGSGSGWLRVFQNDVPVQIKTPCDTELCGAEPIACAAPTFELFEDARDGVTVTFGWDGQVWTGETCQTRSLTSIDGTWEAEFCVGSDITDGTPADFTCERIGFDIETKTVNHTTTFGGEQ